MLKVRQAQASLRARTLLATVAAALSVVWGAANAAVPTPLETAAAESGSSGEENHHAGTGENCDGGPHSVRQPKARNEFAQEPCWENHHSGWDADHGASRQTVR
jgi:hypothetical protein